MNDEVNKSFPTVLVVVPCYNEELYIKQCLVSLGEQDYPRENYKVLVVDNGSSDSSVDIAKQLADHVVIKKGGKVGGVRNFGVRQFSSDIVAFIDADCIANKQWLKTACKILASKEVGAVGGNYLLRDNPSWIERGWVLENFPKSGDANSLVGGSFILRRDLFDEIGGFDAQINAGEDTKLSQMIKNLGLKVLFVEDCAVVHLGYPSTLFGFMKRQFWHSSSYKNSQLGLLKDKTFLAVLVFLLSLIVFVLGMLVNSTTLVSLALIGTFLPPFLFSSKRAFPVFHETKVITLLSAYTLDFAYFVARAIGLLTSFFFDPFKK